MEWTWLGIAAAVVLLLSCAVGFKRGFIGEVVSVLLTILSIVLVWFVNPYMNTFLTDYTPVYERIQEKCDDLVAKNADGFGLEEVSEEAQEQLVDALPIPQLLKKQIFRNNNDRSYQLLDVSGFKDYVATGLANMLLNGLSFFLSFLLCSLAVRLIKYVLEMAFSLPVLKQINQLAGLAVGGAKGIFLIWVIMLGITVFCNTAYGKECMDLIQRDTFLRILYNLNPLIRFFMNMY